MPYIVTVQSGLVDVVLPNGIRAQAGNKVLLSDSEYAQLSPNARVGTSLFSAITPVASGGTLTPTEVISSQGIPYLSGWSDNPEEEEEVDEPSSSTTPLNTTQYSADWEG